MRRSMRRINGINVIVDALHQDRVGSLEWHAGSWENINQRDRRRGTPRLHWSTVLGFQTWSKREDGTMVQPSPADMTNIWTTMVGGPKKGRTYRTGVLQSSSSPSLFPNSFSTLQTMDEMEAMKKQIVKLTQQYAANDAKFAKFEELVKKHMPQAFHDEEDSESDDN
ncbi:hypothetical protein CQW23_18687 [Capsicum baccatum]|uniref:Uncharacterized protein n=1 Tax=Capsicum baccatum TaxID=33114 RepID=A0A2G2W3P8_CAPBA|nr:hypothetical protein CQW23_18687 [Capsicum baccatum]